MWGWVYDPASYPAPAALRAALKAQRWGLPRGGGTENQPMKRMKAMEISLRWYENFRAYQAAVQMEDFEKVSHWMSENEAIEQVWNEFENEEG